MAKRVLPQEAAELLGQGWVYLDVRSIPEFEAGHPAGAANIPLIHAQAGRRFPNADFQKVVEANFPRDSKLVIGCQSGSRSAQAAALLEAAGYAQVVDVRGGMGGERDMFGKVAVVGWVAAGLPVEQTARPGQSYAELSKPKP
jgi:rhodanese-related sulfurtransferase